GRQRLLLQPREPAPSRIKLRPLAPERDKNAAVPRAASGPGAAPQRPGPFNFARSAKLAGESATRQRRRVPTQSRIKLQRRQQPARPPARGEGRNRVPFCSVRALAVARATAAARPRSPLARRRA